jgi:ABC-2 type transport system ATP-binding protein
LFALLGPNGSGKTTTINMLCCLLKPTRGTARVMGFDINRKQGQLKLSLEFLPRKQHFQTTFLHLKTWS